MILVVESKIGDPMSLYWDPSPKHGKTLISANVASLSCQVSLICTQESNPPNLRNQYGV